MAAAMVMVTAPVQLVLEPTHHHLHGDHPANKDRLLVPAPILRGDLTGRLLIQVSFLFFKSDFID